MNILVLNAGSSSLKCHLFDCTSESKTPIWQAHAEWSSQSAPARLKIQSSNSKPIESEIPNAEIPTIVRQLAAALPLVPQTVAHRIVHGGSLFQKATRLTAEVREQAMSYSPSAPSHNKIQLEIVAEILDGGSNAVVDCKNFFEA